MTDELPEPRHRAVIDPEAVRDDPGFPYKAYAAAAAPFVVGLLSQLINVGVDGTPLPIWLVAVFTAIVSGIGVFLTPNPKKAK